MGYQPGGLLLGAHEGLDVVDGHSIELWAVAVREMQDDDVTRDGKRGGWPAPSGRRGRHLAVEAGLPCLGLDGIDCVERDKIVRREVDRLSL